MIAAIGKQYEAAKAGIQRAKIIDVKDLGEVEYPWSNGAKPMVESTFQLRQKNSSGDHIEIKKIYTNTCSPKGNLFNLVAAAGATLTPGFDLETLRGKIVDVLIVHHVSERDGLTYANISQCMRVETEADRQSEQRIAEVTQQVKRAAREHDTKFVDKVPLNANEGSGN